jgi:hypothetical protein
MFARTTFAALVMALTTAFVQAQTITIEGVSDRVTRTNSATFRVQTNAGFSYAVTLNGVPVPAGVSNTVTKMDYYDLAVTRTDLSTLAVTNVLVRFIVESTNRKKASSTTSPELGLLEWVPLPPIPSTAAEMAGAQLDLLAPQSFPAGIDIPVIARVEDESGNARRVNGWVSAPGFEGSAFRVVRGVGFGLLPPAQAGTAISYNGALKTLATNRQIEIDSNTTWTTVSGVLSDATWPTNSRIHVTANLTVPAGVTLTIEAGTVVRLNAGVNITNTGRILVNGTVTQPVVFTPTNRVAPEQRTGAWGGFFMRGATAELTANNAIFTGSGAAASISYSPGSSHRSEQPLLFLHSNAVVRMTNCAAVNLAGQVGNGYFSSMTLERCLVQRAITCGEWEGCTNIIRRSALIEFPSIDGIYDATIADADYDGFYMIKGTNYFAESLLGFAKDDALDAGSGGAGTVTVSNCWVESALHEALAWSGEGRRTWTYDSVLINCGQGIECGWSTTNASSLVSPICFGSNLFSTANCVGARYGDNYTGTSGLGNKFGFLTVTNSAILHNYRDVWGQVWDNTWNYRVNQMDIRSNYITAVNTNHLSNTVWDAAAHAARLAPFMTTPADAPVGVGLALWNLNIAPGDLTNGVPVRLSSFTTNPVTVNYSIETPSSSVAGGTLTFAPGETVKRIFANPSVLGGATTWRVALSSPAGGEITGASAAYGLPAPATNAPATLIAAGSMWRYYDDGAQSGNAWTTLGFDDSTWSNNLAQLGFGDSPRDEVTIIRRTNSANTVNLTCYFRQQFVATDPAAFTNLTLWLLRDDGGVVYLNGNEVFRSSSMPPAPFPITATVLATNYNGGAAPPDNTEDTATLSRSLLQAGTNILAVEIHQQAASSSDLSFDFSLTGNPVTSPRLYPTRFNQQWVLNWAVSGYTLEQADEVTGPWSPVPDLNVPATVDLNAAKKFFRLRR